MFSALFSFLGGSVFRMIWGEISSFIEKKQEHNAAKDTGEMKLFMDLVYAWVLDKGLPLTIPEGCQYDELNKRENGIE